MTDRSPAQTTRDRVDFACFELAGETWAVPIANVREILATPLLTPLPDAPALIEGVIDLRGTLIPVIDLAALLAREVAAAAPRARTVVVAVRGLVVGFRVERATQVVATSRDALERLPELTRAVGCLAVGAVIRRADRPPILVLDLEVVIERVMEARAGLLPTDGVAA